MDASFNYKCSLIIEGVQWSLLAENCIIIPFIVQCYCIYGKNNRHKNGRELIIKRRHRIEGLHVSK